MDINYLKVFNSIAKEKSFKKAAESLHISQPAISIQVRKLEEGLGIKLFDKYGKRSVLNENGKLLYEATSKAFAILEEAEHELLNKNATISGPVSIGGSHTPGTYLLPKIIGAFKKQYPNTSIKLHIANTEEIADMIMNGQLDFAVNGGNFDKYNNSVHVEKLMDDRIVFAVAPSSHLAGAVVSDPEDLKQVDFIAHESNQLNRMIEEIFKQMNLPTKIMMTLGSLEAVKQATAARLGVSPMPSSSITLELELGLLSEFKIKDKEWYFPFNLIYRKNRYMTPAARKLMEMVRTRLGNQVNKKQPSTK